MLLRGGRSVRQAGDQEGRAAHKRGFGTVSGDRFNGGGGDGDDGGGGGGSGGSSSSAHDPLRPEPPDTPPPPPPGAHADWPASSGARCSLVGTAVAALRRRDFRSGRPAMRAWAAGGDARVAGDGRGREDEASGPRPATEARSRPAPYRGCLVPVCSPRQVGRSQYKGDRGCGCWWCWVGDARGGDGPQAPGSNPGLGGADVSSRDLLLQGVRAWDVKKTHPHS